jgi:hypothetical protein
MSKDTKVKSSAESSQVNSFRPAADARRRHIISIKMALLVGLALLASMQQAEVRADGTVEERLPAPSRLVFSLTTTQRRIHLIKRVLDTLVEGQDHPAERVYLALPPGTTVPAWLSNYDATSKRPGVLQVLHMQRDYGPASKLLAALREGGERAADTVVVFGDDDIHYGARINSLHWEAQAAAARPSAFGSRRIGIGSGTQHEELLEATGSVSLRASALPEAAFDIFGQPDACRLSDDYWLSHHLVAAGVALELLPACQYNFHTSTWPSSCGAGMAPAREIESIGALSARGLTADGQVLAHGGDWRDQLKRYEVCQATLLRAAGTSRRRGATSL